MGIPSAGFKNVMPLERGNDRGGFALDQANENFLRHLSTLHLSIDNETNVAKEIDVTEIVLDFHQGDGSQAP
jgi:hypothetical protein